ncbi:MAG: hypothetical protein AAGA15_07805 [Pseudomonadota bacterium]
MQVDFDDQVVLALLMLRFSEAQMQSASHALVERFATKLEGFLRDQVPLHSAAMGDDCLSVVARLSVDRANALGFHTERELQIFAVYSMLFGSYFDSDPQMPWARDRLTRPGLEPWQRIDLFRARAEQEIVEQEETSARQDPLAVLVSLDPNEMAFGRVDYQTALSEWYAALFPGKAKSMRSVDMRELSGRAEELSSSCGLSPQSGPKLMVATMGVLGFGFYWDPRYRRLATILGEKMPAAEKAEAFGDAGRELAAEWRAITDGARHVS